MKINNHLINHKAFDIAAELVVSDLTAGERLMALSKAKKLIEELPAKKAS